MISKKQLKSLLLFYKSFSIPAILISVVSCSIILLLAREQISDREKFYGIIAYVPQAFWTKTVTNIILIYLLLKIKNKELYFYFNLCINKLQLVLSLLLLDYLILAIMLYLTNAILFILYN